ncbi:MAG: arginine deiminase family protein [Bacteroidota bacterium]|nr:arginine deiminase family protein [Candidatus Kapabacteria bacterium]MDW8220806.1 arginine deiminase family protein [Bacteroidota bacterium]
MPTTQRLNIRSEYGLLKTVILHRPSAEIDRLLPDNYRTYLFEDIPFLKKIQREHDQFAELIRSRGAEVLYMEILLEEMLRDEAARYDTLEAVVALERCEGIMNDLMNVSTVELATILLAGLRANEARARGFKVSQYLPDDWMMISPIPNAYFMRDPAAVVGDMIVSSNMLYPARVRESLLIEHIFRFHPRFLKKEEFVYGTRSDERYNSIEGGDIIVLNSEAIAVGCSERTSTEAIAHLASNLFRRKSAIQRVYEVLVPPKREYMHLDTVFTIVAPQTICAHKRSFMESPQTRLYEAASTDTGYKLHSEGRTFMDVLRDEFGSLTVIEVAGGDKYYADREQRTDGANVFTIAPGVVVGYDRNQRTNAALRAAGVEVLDFDGSELVRGLGGARCMTMPIEREDS